MLSKNKFYNNYHRKNKHVQVAVVRKSNYTYQTLVSLIDKYVKGSVNILDVGCGVGTIDFYLASKGHSVTGVDISSRAIDLAKESAEVLGLRSVNFLKLDASSLPTQEKYNLVICSEVIEHVENDEHLLDQIALLLSKDGLLMLSTPSSNAPLYKWGLLDQFDKDVGHLRRYTLISLCKKVEQAGFQVIETKKVEGLLRNSLYTIEPLGFFVKFVKWPLTCIVNIFDHILIQLFGESNLYVVAKKR